MRAQLRLLRQDPQDGTTKRLLLDVELHDSIHLVDDPAP
jgi:hypothetical protein